MDEQSAVGYFEGKSRNLLMPHFIPRGTHTFIFLQFLLEKWPLQSSPSSSPVSSWKDLFHLPHWTRSLRATESVAPALQDCGRASQPGARLCFPPATETHTPAPLPRAWEPLFPQLQSCKGSGNSIPVISAVWHIGHTCHSLKTY